MREEQEKARVSGDDSSRAAFGRGSPGVSSGPCNLILTGGGRDALGIGPLPLTWVIPDRQYKPTRPTLKLLPGSKFEAFFRSWGIVEKAEMIFQQDRTIYLLVRFAKREVMAQVLTVH
eukprot:g15749.t1